jgi:hypothetical protein
MNALVERLVAKMPADDVYPPGVVVPIKPRLRGRSFFPGGSGLFNGAKQPLCARPVMLVAREFGTQSYWNEVGDGDESTEGTWSSLSRMLASTGVDPSSCFFTNVLLGVRASGKGDDALAALAHPVFVDACLAFLLEQIRVVNPAVVVTLGRIPTILAARVLKLADSIPPASAVKHRNASWRQLDAICGPFHAEVKRAGLPTFAFAASVDPVRCDANIKRRSWPAKGLVGRATHDLVWKHIAAAQQNSSET